MEGTVISLFARYTTGQHSESIQCDWPVPGSQFIGTGSRNTRGYQNNEKTRTGGSLPILPQFSLSISRT